MSTWTCSLSWDNLVYTSPPAGANRWEFIAGLRASCLQLTDPLPVHNAPLDYGDFYFHIGANDAVGNYQLVQLRFGDAEIDPPNWQTTFHLPYIPGGGASPAASGTLSITKDDVALTVTFTGPYGSQTLNLSDVAGALPDGSPGYLNAYPLRCRGMAHEFAIHDPTAFSPAIVVDHQIQWHDMIDSLNGTPYHSVALSTADPGPWWPIFYDKFDPVGGGTSSDPSQWTWTQLATREKVEAQQSIVPSIPFTWDYPDAFRIFDSFRNLRDVMASTPMDLTAMPEHDILFGAWSPAPNQAFVRRSHDHGHTWSDYAAELTTPAASISVQTYAGQVWICYYDGTHIVTQKSYDLGLSWSTPTPVSITGTNPRLVIAPDGPQFYFYFDGSGNLLLSRSLDFGVTLFDITPIPVAAGLTPQDFGAVMAADRSLVVSFILSGSWTSMRSQDLGNTWAVV